MDNKLNCMTCMIGRFKDDLCDGRFCEKCKKVGNTQDVEQALILASKIVRCKDCMYCNVVNTKDAYAYCIKHGFTFYPFQDDTRKNYCSWGERSE